MKGIIAKKYVNALIKSCSDAEIISVENAINELATAFSSTKFNNIILSPDFSSEKKEEFVLSLLEKSEGKILNLVKLLALNDRLALIPVIAKELKYQTSLKSNSFEGEVVSNFEIGKEQITKLEENFSKKFSANIKLNNVVSDYPGVKIQLDDLGVEVSFSLDRLKTQMVEHILKAI
ncbi:F0F1 ATP synthase subunit delta [Sulfurospirillum arcachonense]|uniref:F0F1 ATP synthase subunit delta n=1 Tax=Sulfurospirillum arcachonense TaxID=57666 RepID=UPI000468A28A|nr:F0F1 ATP synthase subunit delta [Sulfurospirillum arcachonense]